MKVKSGGLAAGNYAEKALRQNEGWKKQGLQGTKKML